MKAANHSLAVSAAVSVRSLASWGAFLLGTLLALPFVLALALTNSFSYDEHQHIAAGVLFARDGLLPYRDFPFFHVPYLVYIYGLLFKFTDQYVLASRVFSAVCAALTCGAVFATAWRLFAGRSVGQRLAIAGSALTLLLAAPMVYGTVGLSWNQEPSVLLALLAFLAHHSALERECPGRWLLLSGLLLGLAIGVRVTLAPLVLPFAGMLWLMKAPVRKRVRTTFIFSAGIALALLPVLCAAIAAPAGFIFGNVEFPKLNIDYRLASGEPRTMTMPTKLRFLFKEIVRPNWMLFFGFLAAWTAAWVRPPVPRGSWPRLLWFVLITFPFLLLGGLAPSPVFDQYFYPLAPFLIIGTLALFAGLPAGTPRLRWMWGAGVALVFGSVALASREYVDLQDLFRAQNWIPSKLHSQSEALRRLVPGGRVLTLAPTLPLEAGLQIYPELATGPFAWRVAPFVARERRAGLRMLAGEDLASRVENDPPVAILLGFADRWEEPLARYAQAKGYHLTSFLKDKQLWIAPAKVSAKPGSSTQSSPN